MCVNYEEKYAKDICECNKFQMHKMGVFAFYMQLCVYILYHTYMSYIIYMDRLRTYNIYILTYAALLLVSNNLLLVIICNEDYKGLQIQLM